MGLENLDNHSKDMLLNALKTLRAAIRPNIHLRMKMYFCLVDNLMSRQKKRMLRKSPRRQSNENTTNGNENKK